MRWTARGGPLAGRAEQQWRLPERAGDQRRRDVRAGTARGPRHPRPREDEERHDERGERRRKRRERSELRDPLQPLVERHEEDGETVGREDVVVEARRAGRIDAWPPNKS